MSLKKDGKPNLFNIGKINSCEMLPKALAISGHIMDSSITNCFFVECTIIHLNEPQPDKTQGASDENEKKIDYIAQLELFICRYSQLGKNILTTQNHFSDQSPYILSRTAIPVIVIVVFFFAVQIVVVIRRPIITIVAVLTARDPCCENAIDVVIFQALKLLKDRSSKLMREENDFVKNVLCRQNDVSSILENRLHFPNSWRGNEHRKNAFLYQICRILQQIPIGRNGGQLQTINLHVMYITANRIILLKI
uniref:Uncharacterized protein n=1 Tax=Romanomermis culicivorax TaxID=13658 RepID=A0A915JHR7_ROMCU